MKLCRILTAAAIGAAAALALMTFVSWELPWNWDWQKSGTMIRLLLVWATCFGAMFGAFQRPSSGVRS